MQILSERIKTMLEAQKMSYQQLSDITHISKATLHRYSQGITAKIPIERIWSIAFALNTTPQYLMGDIDDPSPGIIGHIKPFLSHNNDILMESLAKRDQQSAEFHSLLVQIHDLNENYIHPTLSFISMLKQNDI